MSTILGVISVLLVAGGIIAIMVTAARMMDGESFKDIWWK